MKYLEVEDFSSINKANCSMFAVADVCTLLRVYGEPTDALATVN